MDNKKDKQSNDTIGLIVHSYNNYLSGLMGFTELAKLESQQVEVTEKMEMALLSGYGAVDFGKQLLASVSRLQLKIQIINSVPLIESICSEYQCDLVLENKQEEYLIETNSEWFERSLVILIKFCRALQNNCNIQLILDNTDASKARLVIRPSDLEIERKHIAHLFEPFYSSRTMLATQDVGLAVAHGFVVQMKGELNWHEEQGFVIDLPLLKK